MWQGMFNPHSGHGMIHFYMEIDLGESFMSTIKNRQEASVWQKKYDALAPKVGDYAPDFELRDVQGNNPIKLSDYQGNIPIVLILGSFT